MFMYDFTYELCIHILFSEYTTAYRVESILQTDCPDLRISPTERSVTLLSATGCFWLQSSYSYLVSLMVPQYTIHFSLKPQVYNEGLALLQPQL